MSSPNRQLELVLQCLECGAESADGRGWRAYLDEDDELLVYCASCAAREFGDD